MVDRSRVGYAFVPQSPQHAIDLVERAERAGLDTVWSIMRAVGLDSLTIYAAAAMRTERIRLGTAIVPAFTRHPLGMMTQIEVLEALAPGRLRLGIGTAHAATMVNIYHFDFSRPLSQLREYLEVLLPLLATGEVHMKGDFYEVDATIPKPLATPVLVSALRAPAFALAAEMASGALAWLCPPSYLQSVALPAMESAAAVAGRVRPPLIAHSPVVVSSDRAKAFATAKQQLAFYAAAPFYARMFKDAGQPLDDNGGITDGLLDELLVWGTPEQIADQLRTRLASGVDEIYPSMLTCENHRAEEDQLLEILANL